MSKDWHAQGEQDRQRDRDMDSIDIFVSGGQGAWDPPSDPDDREAYEAGWENA